MAALKTELDIGEKHQDNADSERAVDIIDENAPTDEAKKKKKKKKKKTGERVPRKARLCVLNVPPALFFFFRCWRHTGCSGEW